MRHRSIRARATGLAAASLLVALCACNINKLTANASSGAMLHGSIALDREADLDFARQAMPASLKTVETFLVNSPENEDMLLLLARGYNSYAFAFVEEDFERATIAGDLASAETAKARARMHYMRGSEYGLRLLNEPALTKAARANDVPALKAELAKVDREQAPALFWAGFGWASAANLSLDDPAMLLSLPTIEAIMTRVYELEPGYNGGGPILFHAVYHGSRPQALGGKPELAKRYFEEALAKHGDANLLIPYLYARIYAVQMQDRALFDRLVERVLSADVTAHPDFRLSNEVARARARFWKEHLDQLFAG